ncbi:MAG TPA: PRC-barrel domain-containing protein [Falsiroseomonas sp.]|jgi:sporulation protein YlmC with PRC-barrel domain|nr:PRC-barrel domain-containing protein [Falsiroseomonas sp.]
MQDRKTTGAGAESGKRGGVAINETEALIASDKVEGTPVYNHAGEHLGSIYTLMLDKVSGKVRYAVMSFGGFLGIGEHYHPLPWDKLTYEPRQGGYVVDVTREQLEGAPRYARNETPWSDPLYGQSVYGYYGVPFPRI